MTLNFLWSGQVIASGPNSFWTSGATGEALNYSLSSDSVGSVITFVPAVGGGSWFDTARFIYTAVSSREISLEVPPCPPGVPCYAGAGDVYVFER